MWVSQRVTIANNGKRKNVSFLVHQPAVEVAGEHSWDCNNWHNKAAEAAADSAKMDCCSRNCDQRVIIVTDDDANLDNCPCDMDRKVFDSNPSFSDHRDSP